MVLIFMRGEIFTSCIAFLISWPLFSRDCLILLGGFSQFLRFSAGMFEILIELWQISKSEERARICSFLLIEDIVSLKDMVAERFSFTDLDVESMDEEWEDIFSFRMAISVL